MYASYIEDSLQKLNRSEIDFLIRLDREKPHPELLTSAGRQESVVFVTWPGNPLLNKKDLTLSDIAQADFIVSGRNISYSAQLEREFISRGIEFRPVMDIGSVGAIISMLLSGYGVSFLPEFTVREQIKKGELIALKLQDEISVDLYASYICNPDRWINPVMKEFIRIVQAHCIAGI
ncbi:MAG: substrate-binding domain-containing protein [Mogibacterium sp.]|nr:substrate-binding domain-containing protein [Mogibacterium sp.]